SAGLLGHIHESFSDARAAGVGIRSFIELYLQDATTFHGRPGVVGDDSHASRNLYHLLDAGTSFGLGRVEARDLSTKYRAARHHRIQHSRYFRVDAEHGLAIDFAGRVQAL